MRESNFEPLFHERLIKVIEGIIEDSVNSQSVRSEYLIPPKLLVKEYKQQDTIVKETAFIAPAKYKHGMA